MKLFLGILIFVFSSTLVPAADELESIRDLLNLYRPEAMERYKKPIKFSIQRSSKMNAYATVRFVGPNIYLTTTALKELNDDEVLSTMCHELGHFFGKRFGWTISGLAIEGEADYFSGGCLVRFLKEVRRYSHRHAIEEATEIAKREAVAFAEGRLIWERGYLDFYRGIKKGYPPAECRLLTVIHGIRDWKRPECWYNPGQ